jgi:predicted permease
MASFMTAFQSISPLFLVIFVGIGFGRKKPDCKPWIEILNNYALWVGLPALILVALSRIQWNLNLYGNLILWNSVRIVLAILLVLPFSYLLKLKNQTRRMLFLAVSYGNVAYLGIPILRSSYGDQILPEATMISAVYIFWLFTLCIFMVEFYGDKKTSSKELFIRLATNPLLLAVLTGLIIALNEWKLPQVMLSGLDIFANSVTAVVLFSLGLFIGNQPIGKFMEWIPVLIFSLVILFVFPAVFLLITQPFIDLEMSRTWILEAAMPMGLTAYALCLKYDLNSEFASRTVVLSTLLALLSLPFWLIFLK